MVEKSDDGTIIKSYDFWGGKKMGEFAGTFNEGFRD